MYTLYHPEYGIAEHVTGFITRSGAVYVDGIFEQGEFTCPLLSLSII